MLTVRTIKSDPRNVHHVRVWTREDFDTVRIVIWRPVIKCRVRIEAAHDYHPPDPANERSDTMMRQTEKFFLMRLSSLP